MTEPIRAIDTKYRGFLFRSRLEARWAVFLDQLAVGFRYELEGFDLGRGRRYLPDFYLPKLDCWLEIKPAEPDERARDLCASLAIQTRKPVYLFFGDLMCPSLSTSSYWYGEEAQADKFFPGGGVDNHYLWCECPFCHALGIEFDGRSDRLSCKRELGCPAVNGDKGYNSGSPRLTAAYEIARASRFDGHDPWAWKIEA